MYGKVVEVESKYFDVKCMKLIHILQKYSN